MRRSIRLLVLGTVLVAIAIKGYDLVTHQASHPSSTQTVPYHPADVVKAWAQTFPREGLLAAMLTTEAFRDGATPASWAEKTRPVWEAVRFRYLRGPVLSGWIKGATAMVVFQSTASSVWGTHVRQEQYRLLRGLQGEWLIDQVQLVKENVL